MSWSQNIDKPLRPRADIYLDGLVTGGVLTWILSMLYELNKRESSETVGMVVTGVVIAALAVGILFRVRQLRRDGN